MLSEARAPAASTPASAARATHGAQFARDLAAHGDRLAVVTGDGAEITYEDLAARVTAMADRLGTTRRLVLVGASNDLDPLVAYLAALAGGHPVLLASGGSDRRQLERLAAVYDPDVVLSSKGAEWVLDERRSGSAHTLHPDLALLLSTSGSTGSSKLVRLSHENLQSNAEAIAAYLDIRDTDRAATSLPMQYCYGLSVLNSHLLRGAGLLLTNDSVVDACFWSRFRTYGGTSFAGVPYTFELLDRVGFESMDLPSLRYVTQAGGRLPPDAVRRFAALGKRDGWQLYVMYGQTEATARMAYVPPDRALECPSAIGVPIPGGSFEIEADDRPGEGELLYRGPNVMLGYAEKPGDLALGRTVDVLHTGDLARRNPDGLYEVIGRKSRFLKLFGIRVDLARIEELLRERGHATLCTGTDDALILAVTGGSDVDEIPRLVNELCGLPRSCVRVCEFAELPHLPNGKPDYTTVQERGLVEPEANVAPPPRRRWRRRAGRERSVTDEFAEVLGCDAIGDDDTFVGLGGDSLSYVEVSMWFEEELGYVPTAWHITPIGQLRGLEPKRRWWKSMETDIVLRAVAIVLVVGSHVALFALQGGAHLLLAIAGYNFARFRLTASEQMHRLRHDLASIVRIAVPALVVIALPFFLLEKHSVPKLLLVNNYLGEGRWRYWYIEVLLQLLVVLAVAFSIPAVRRYERVRPYAFALAALVISAGTAFVLVGLGDSTFRVFKTHLVGWVFVIGWAAQRAATPFQKATVSLFGVLAVPWFFDKPSREVIVLGGLLLLVWLPRVRVPGFTTRFFGLVAAASLYIYLTHFETYPPLRGHLPLLAIAAVAIVAGIAAWLLERKVTTSLGALAHARAVRGETTAAKPAGARTLGEWLGGRPPTPEELTSDAQT